MRLSRDSAQLPEIVVTPETATPAAPGSAGDPLVQLETRRFDRYDKPPFLQRAVVIIDGVMYYEWTTVEVRVATDETPPATFKLTVSEQEVPRDSTSAFRIVPGDLCDVFLDGFNVINGFVKTRQVFYDGASHQVEIQGEGNVGRLTLAAATSQTGELPKNIPAIGAISMLAGAAGVPTMPIGGLSATPLEQHRITPGASAWEEITKIAPQFGGMLTEWFGSLVVGDMTSAVTVGNSVVIEGYNIVEAREVIHLGMNPGQNSPLLAQRPGNDQVSGADAAQQQTNSSGSGGGAGVNHATRSLMELPGWSQGLMALRARHESIVSATNEILVTIGLVGWQRPGIGGLWYPMADNVIVDSPMLVLRQVPLMLKAVTYTQDDHTGTRAAIELVNKPGSGAVIPLSKNGGGEQQPQNIPD
jgi:prophage tail gpP-like protein